MELGWELESWGYRFLILEEAEEEAEEEAMLGGGIGEERMVVVGRGKAMALQPAQQCK